MEDTSTKAHLKKLQTELRESENQRLALLAENNTLRAIINQARGNNGEHSNKEAVA